MSQMICGGADVGPNRLPHQSLRVVLEIGRQQRFHGWPNAVDDRAKVPRLVACRLLKFFQGCQNRSALGVPENHHQPCALPPGGELDAADLRRCDDVSGNANDEQVAKALIEDDLRWHPRVGTTENDGERLLTCRHFVATPLVRERVAAPGVRREATISRSKALECFARGDHRSFVFVRLTTTNEPRALAGKRASLHSLLAGAVQSVMWQRPSLWQAHDEVWGRRRETSRHRIERTTELRECRGHFRRGI